MITAQKTNYILLAAFAIVVFITLVQQCNSDKAMKDLTDQIARYQDTVISRRVVDGDVVNDTKGSELTLEQYKALDAQKYASFERMLRNDRAQMLATVSLLISRPPITGDAPVTINPVTKARVIDLTDSCSLIGNVTLDSTGKATKNITQRVDSLDLVIARDRLKWWQAKEITASSVIRNNCGTITGQKAVVVSPGKKKVVETGLFKAIVFIATGFLIGRL